MALSQQEIIDEIRDALMQARMCWQAWWIFTGPHPQRPAIVSVYNRYRDFFGTIHAALFTTSVLKLASLFETNDQKVSIRMIPGAEAETNFQSLWERGRRLYTFRSRVVAHTDIRKTAERFAKDTGFSYDDIKDLLADACNSFNALSAKLRVETIPPLTPVRDLLRLIGDLERKQ